MIKPINSFQRLAAAALGGLLLIGASVGTVDACEGTAEYPRVAAKLAKASMPADKKAALTQKLKSGEALHAKAHRADDKKMMNQSLKILSQVEGAI